MKVRANRYAVPALLGLLLMGACAKSDGGKDSKSQAAPGPTPAPGTNTDTAANPDDPAKTDDPNKDNKSILTNSDPNAIPVTGSLSLSTLALTTGAVSHVIAVDTESGKVAYAEVKTDGTFELGIGKEHPWVISYVDDSKSGSDMIVSSFASDSLDTLSPGKDTTKVELGAVDVSAAKATMGLSATDLLTSIGMSAGAAATMGSLDDVSLRYSNPDIDNNGKIDVVEGKFYGIDFHNRFTAHNGTGGQYSIQDMKNAFYPDDTKFTYTGTGIFPQIPKDDFGGTDPTSYEWSFSVDMPVAGNGGAICAGKVSGDTLAAGTACSLTKQDNVGSDGNALTFGMETANLAAGDYTLKAGGKTFFWKNVAVSDFSAGEGFLTLFIRIDVDTGSDKVTGISYKWQKKGADNTYSLATAEEIKLIVKSSESGSSGYVSLKYQGDEAKGSLGISVPMTPSGSVTFADLKADDNSVYVNGTVLTRDMVKAGIPFSDLTSNPGISYDDKLGMRFFF